MSEHRVVLCLQDSAELDFNGQAIEGLGPLTYEAQRGMFLHATYAVTLGREPLGVLDAWMWARAPKDESAERGGLKESIRWTEGYERVAELAAGLPDTRLVYVADREADIMALMARARDLGQPADWLIRSRHNRALPEGGKLWAAVTAQAPLGEVRQQVWAKRIELPDAKRGRVTATCIVAREMDAPAGVKPLELRACSATARPRPSKWRPSSSTGIGRAGKLRSPSHATSTRAKLGLRHGCEPMPRPGLCPQSPQLHQLAGNGSHEPEGV